MTDHRRTSRAIAIARTEERRKWTGLAAAGGLAVIAALLAGAAKSDSHETVIEAHGVTNFGDLMYPADFAHANYVNPEAPKGGEIAVWAQGTFDSFNQYTRQGVSASLNTLPYESILTSFADDPYGAYCYLCTTMEYPESRDWVIFNLRDDVTFSDGTPMTAEDVAFTFNLFLTEGIVEYRSVVESFIDTVEVLGPHEIKFTFTEEAPRRDVLTFAGGTSVFSKAEWEERGLALADSTLEPWMGTGAYMLDEYDINRQIIYGRNPNFWGGDHPVNIGRNNFDSIRVEYFADSSAAFEGFKSGAYTFRNENSSKDWATGYEFPAVDRGWVKVEELPDGNIGSGQAFVFNLREEKWQDPRVREAVSMMFNFEWSNESLFFGLYDRTTSFWENSDLAATGTPSEVELAVLEPLVAEGLLPESILTDEVVMPPANEADDNTPSRSMIRAAGRLLDEAGWEAGDDGMRRKDGEVLDLTILQFSPAFDRIVNPYIENLQRLGIDAKLERVDTSQYIERRRSGDYDLVNHSLGQGYEPGISLRQWFDSSTAEDSSRNLMGLQNAAVDRLITEVIDETDFDTLTQKVHALDRVLRAEKFWVPQWYKPVHTVAYYDMFRYPDPLPPLALGNLDFWWYDAEAAAELEEAGAFQ